MSFASKLFPIACLALLCAIAETADPAAKTLTVTIGKGDLLQFNNDVQRVAVAEPKIADAIVVSPREVMVNAKGIGKTTVVIWESGSAAVRYDVNVVSDTSDIDALQRELRAMTGSNVIVSGTPESLVLSGSAANADVSKHAQALAATHAKTVVNLLQTPTGPEPRQIMLQVKFASVDRARLAELGFNLFSRNPGGIGETSTQQFQQPRFSQLQFQNQDFSNTTVNFADILNLFLFRADLNIGATVRALQ